MANKHIKTGLALKSGTMLQNRYRICFCVGRGGFGIAYEALDTKFNIPVCVKEFFNSDLMYRNNADNTLTISENHRDEFFVRKERFIAEAQNAALFSNHNNIPNVYEVFNENNTAYIVMELLDGEELSTYLKETEGPLPTDLALMIANEVCEALKAMHKKKIIHCDVAPDNIYLCSNEEIRVKLIDFGAAHFEKEKDSIDTVVKPGYSAVEQYHGKNDVDGRSDIYSLGATLYMMLTGMKPQESIERKNSDNLIEPKILNPLISDNLNNTILKAMAIEKHMRFDNVEEFQKALKDEVIVPPLKVEHKKRNIRRNILFSAITLLCVFCMLTALFNGESQYRKTNLKKTSITIQLESDYGDAIYYLIEQFRKEYPQVDIVIARNACANVIGNASEKTAGTIYLYDYSTIKKILENNDRLLNLNELQSSEEYKVMKEDEDENNFVVSYGWAVPVCLVFNETETETAENIDYENSEIYIDEALKDVSLSEKYNKFKQEEVQSGTLEQVASKAQEGTACVYLMDSTQLIDADEMLTGMDCRFIYGDARTDSFPSLQAVCEQGEWEQNNAMVMFLKYLCMDSCQEILMIRKNNEGHIPYAKTAMEAYCTDRRYYKEIEYDE